MRIIPTVTNNLDIKHTRAGGSRFFIGQIGQKPLCGDHPACRKSKEEKF
jgi:hypothetical protein